MSAIEETRAAGAGKDTHAGGEPSAPVGGVHPAPAPPDVTALVRTGLVLPRAPRPGQPWQPRSEAESHLLGEARRLDRARQLLLAEVGRLRHLSAAPRATGQEDVAAAVRDAQRSAVACPLGTTQLAVLVGAARGERPDETAARLQLATGTVTSTRVRAVRRIGALNITHAVALAVAAGWIRPKRHAGGEPR